MRSILLALVLLGVACGQAQVSPAEPDYPDAITRELARQAREPRPVPNSALPPRHLDSERFPDSRVERTRIVSGGPPADGIPSIDRPRFSDVEQVDWVDESEAVVVLDAFGNVRIYPVQILIWHEIVNDVVGGNPIAVTYCPLCNSAVAFDRRIGATVLEFGTSGALFDSALVMYDRQTESLWTHFDGRAVIGDRVGDELAILPVQTLSWAQARELHPDATVLNRDTGHARSYGVNPYPGYGSSESPLTGFFTREIPDDLPEKEPIIGVRPESVSDSVAVPLSLVQQRGVVNASAGATPFVVFHEPGRASALDTFSLAAGEEVGSSAVYSPVVDGETLTFESGDNGITDANTGSGWNMAGRAVSGPLNGNTLAPVDHLDTFWFAWASFHPETTIIE